MPFCASQWHYNRLFATERPAANPNSNSARLDVLHAAGAEHVKAIVVCIDAAAAATRIVELIKAEFAHVPVPARSIVGTRLRSSTPARIFHLRETFESALRLGARGLETLGGSA